MQTYVLIGAGGTASHLIRALVRYLDAYHSDGEWRLHIIDGDTVETPNLTRQLFSAEHIDMLKVEALDMQIRQDTLMSGRPVTHIQTYGDYLSPRNIATKILDGDIVLICADNHFIRGLLQGHAHTLQNLTIINGGNEESSGSVQLYTRSGGQNRTPPLSYLHPEILDDTIDRSTLSCAEIAQLPGGEQTIVANMTTAALMLATLWRYHNDRHLSHKEGHNIPVTELQFDHYSGTYYGIDWRYRDEALRDA